MQECQCLQKLLPAHGIHVPLQRHLPRARILHLVLRERAHLLRPLPRRKIIAQHRWQPPAQSSPRRPSVLARRSLAPLDWGRRNMKKHFLIFINSSIPRPSLPREREVQNRCDDDYKDWDHNPRYAPTPAQPTLVTLLGGRDGVPNLGRVRRLLLNADDPWACHPPRIIAVRDVLEFLCAILAANSSDDFGAARMIIQKGFGHLNNNIVDDHPKVLLGGML